MKKTANWWALPTLWLYGSPRAFGGTPPIPACEKARIRGTLPATEDAALRNVKLSAMYHEGLLYRQLLALDGWYAVNQPEMIAYELYKTIGVLMGMNVYQVAEALKTAHRWRADGML